MKKLILVAALFLISSAANATVLEIKSGRMVSWTTQGTGAPGSYIIYENATGPAYACNGLDYPSNGGPTTCAAVPTPTVWAGAAQYSGSVNDDLSFLNLNWTGQVGTSVYTSSFGGFELFNNSVANGSYDAAGTPGGTFACWNNPVASGTLYGADFCGNGTGGTPPTTAVGQTIGLKNLGAGLISFTDLGGGQFQIVMADTSYTDCVNDPNCSPTPNETTDSLVTYNLSSVPVPAAVWLFGSALGLLGWLRRKTT